MTVLVPFTLACTIWALWIRRITWHCKWEVAATLNITMQGAAMFLMSPFASETLGVWLHHHTGMYNLEDYLAHDCYIVAASAIVYNITGRLGNNRIFQERFTRWVEYPVTIAIPVLLAAFMYSDTADQYAGDFFTIPTDRWLAVYWLGLGTLVTLLLGYAIRGLLILRRHPASRRTANAYLTACSCAILACLIRAVTALNPTLQQWGNGELVWFFATITGVIFAVSAGRSWLQRIKVNIPDRVPA